MNLFPLQLRYLETAENEKVSFTLSSYMDIFTWLHFAFQGSFSKRKASPHKN